MSIFEARFERLEVKYLIDEVVADRLRRDIAPYCHPDIHNQSGPNHSSYEISSLYLDSPSLAFHRAKERGDAERLKLRVRSYAASNFGVMELKRKVADVIDKKRAAVLKAEVENAAYGFYDADDETEEVRAFLQEFAFIVASAGAEPTLLVRYDREAYVSSVDAYARVTFDRNITAQRTDRWAIDHSADLACHFDDYWRPDTRDKNVVLELKCEASIPHWMSDLVRGHSLVADSFSKYSIGIHLTGRHGGAHTVPQRSSKVMIA